jgi:hypothetical protein
MDSEKPSDDKHSSLARRVKKKKRAKRTCTALSRLLKALTKLCSSPLSFVGSQASLRRTDASSTAWFTNWDTVSVRWRDDNFELGEIQHTRLKSFNSSTQSPSIP